MNLLKAYDGEEFNVEIPLKGGELYRPTQEDVQLWSRLYTRVDVVRSAVEAAEWCVNNPRRRKKDGRRFLMKWLKREQEKS